MRTKTDNTLYFYSGSKNEIARQLSNFYLCRVPYNGVTYRSAEHAYQAAKSPYPYERNFIAAQTTAKDAKQAGKFITVRRNWNAVKDTIMWEIVLAKFSYNSNLRDSLLSTHNTKLVHYAPWEIHSYWGMGKQGGLNKLGQILMAVRAELESQEYQR